MRVTAEEAKGKPRKMLDSDGLEWILLSGARTWKPIDPRRPLSVEPIHFPLDTPRK